MRVFLIVVTRLETDVSNNVVNCGDKVRIDSPL